MGIGRPQESAVYHVAKLATESYGVPVIADGGCSGASQIAMALTLGASTVMCGSLFAGTTESPGEAFFHDGMRLKLFRGTGSLDMLPKGPAMDPGKAVGAVSCAVVERGSVYSLLSFLLDGVRRDLRRLGVASVSQLHSDLYQSNTRFHVRSSAF